MAAWGQSALRAKLAGQPAAAGGILVYSSNPSANFNVIFAFLGISAQKWLFLTISLPREVISLGREGAAL
jgi:hypothetical protein